MNGLGNQDRLIGIAIRSWAIFSARMMARLLSEEEYRTARRLDAMVDSGHLRRRDQRRGLPAIYYAAPPD